MTVSATVDQPAPVQGRPRYRIAMVAACPLPQPRGTPIRAHRMAESLAQRGHEVHVVTYHLGEPLQDQPFHIHRIRHVPTCRHLDPGPSYQKLLVLDPLLRLTLGRVLRERRFDLIHAHHYEGLLVAQSVRAAVRPPTVYDAHTLLSSELHYYRLALSDRLKRSLGQILDRRLPGRAAHVIAVTGTLRDRLVEMAAVPAERITVIENGVEASLLDVPPMAVPNSGVRVVYSGNLASYQGIEYLLEAFAIVACQRPDARLELASHSSLDAYAPLIRRLGIGDRIKLVDIGFDELAAYLGSADITVNPRAECDGVPQKLMNYMACGCPIVSFGESAAHLVLSR